MNDFARLITSCRFPGPQSWVMPAYGVRSIINLMNSLLAYYGVEAGTPLAFHDDFLAALHGRRKIQFLLLDGLGWSNLEEARARLAIEGLTVLTREEFLRLRLLGDPPYHLGLLDRIGDLILLPHGSRRFLYQYQRRPHTAMNGRHGGMTPEQMVVPLLVFCETGD
jgi:hypothetical protein